MPDKGDYDSIIIGGGFFGCCLALHLKQSRGQHVVILEMEPQLLQRASYANQARVHNGYHYPRSLLTALRSRVNFPRFVNDYSKCIVSDFDKYYAIGRLFSKVTATQYRLFCERIGAPIERAPKDIRYLFNPDLIEDVFVVKEYAFDAERLRETMLSRLLDEDIEIRFGTEAQTIHQVHGSLLEVTCTSPEGTMRITAASVLNCTYSRLNKILADSDLPLLYLKHELTEMALVEVPDEIKNSGITVMCGPFFSIMPFPPLGLHTLSHVRYTPHCEWYDTNDSTYVDPYEYFRTRPKKTNYYHMIRDVSRYMPCLSGCRYVGDSIWELKAVLPSSEVDDSRPVLYRKDHGVPNLTCLMGGKIDNIYDVIEFLDAAHA